MHVREIDLRPATGHEEAFAAAYGPAGDWVSLYRAAPGFVDLRLLSHPRQRGWWRSVERWKSAAARSAFHAANAADCARVEASCAVLVAERREVPVVLRQALRADIAAMHRVRMTVQENRLTSTTLTRQDYVGAIEGEGRGWVLEVDGELVGFCAASAATGNIWALFLLPAHEARGYGQQLHDAMVAWLWEQGLSRLWLTTDPGTRAQRFYESAGWAPAGQGARGELRLELHRPT